MADAEENIEVAAPARAAGWLRANSASLGWWVAGLAMGGLLAVTVLPALRPAATVPVGDKAALQKIVRDTIMDNPEIIPQAINRMQEINTSTGQLTGMDSGVFSVVMGTLNTNYVRIERLFAKSLRVSKSKERTII